MVLKKSRIEDCCRKKESSGSFQYSLLSRNINEWETEFFVPQYRSELPSRNYFFGYMNNTAWSSGFLSYSLASVLYGLAWENIRYRRKVQDRCNFKQRIYISSPLGVQLRYRFSHFNIILQTIDDFTKSIYQLIKPVNDFHGSTCIHFNN